MIFFGNDIVDLLLPDNKEKSKDSRVIEKILNERERKNLSAIPDHCGLLWTFWACKEAVCKAAVKLGLPKSGNPHEYEIEFTDLLSNRKGAGSAKYLNTDFTVQFAGTSSYVHAIAFSGKGKTSEYITSIEFVDSSTDASIFAKEVLLTSVSDCYSIEKKKLACHKNELGIPIITNNNVVLDIDISLSHDGNWLAVIHN